MCFYIQRHIVVSSAIQGWRLNCFIFSPFKLIVPPEKIYAHDPGLTFFWTCVLGFYMGFFFIPPSISAT